MALIEDAFDRAGHVAVTWRDSVIVRGGAKYVVEKKQLENNCVQRTQKAITKTICKVYIHNGGEWITKHTSGDVPLRSLVPAAHVIKDTMWVFGGHNEDYEGNFSVYSLDLISWSWRRVTYEEGTLEYGPGSSWVYKEKIYIMAGTVCYDVATGRRETACGRGASQTSQWSCHHSKKRHSVLLRRGK